MTYKRQIDRLPIVPKEAKEFNVTCHYCIVGCGYKAYTWPVNKQGGGSADSNKFAVDLRKQQGPGTAAWYSPSMYNIVRQNDEDVHIVIKPDKNCVVNAGLGSIRGARMAEMSYSRTRNTQLQRLTEPMVWRYGQMQPTSWDDALDLVARVTTAVIDDAGEDGVIVSAYDHGGAGGGYENTWATGKLYFGAMKIKNIRMHNRPAYNSEVHASRDMGVAELNNCYEDAELADTIIVVGANPLETQTNYFLNHWIPNLRGASGEKKKAEFGSESIEPSRIIIVDPRRTVTVNACEVEAGKERVMHLAVNPGTDLALFNAWLTLIAENGWIDRSFIAESTKDFDAAFSANKMSVERAARITGLTVDQIRKSSEWIAKPKQNGARRRALFAYEKGLIWGNDNYRTNAALVNLALATGNIGRAGGGCVRLGGHQEGYCRPSDAHIGRPAIYVDQLLIDGKGGVHHIWGCDHYKTTVNALKFKEVYKTRTDLVKDAMSHAPYGDREAMVDAIVRAINKGGLFSMNVDIIPSQIGQACHVWLPAATAGEMNLTSMNGERRMRLTERYMDPPGTALPDCLIVARLANHIERVLREKGRTQYADRFKGFDWRTEEDAFIDGYQKNQKGGEFVSYERLRAMGTNGFQEPAIDFRDGQIVGVKRLYTDGVFSTLDGKAKFMQTRWRGLQAPGKAVERKNWPFLINNGRSNHIWQSAYLDQQNDFVVDRWPYPFIELNPLDMDELKVRPGDLVEIYNKNGATQAMAYPASNAKRKQAFMLFGHPAGAHGNVVSPGLNELLIPNYKQTWGAIRKLADASANVRHLTFKSPEYTPA